MKKLFLLSANVGITKKQNLNQSLRTVFLFLTLVSLFYTSSLAQQVQKQAAPAKALQLNAKRADKPVVKKANIEVPVIQAEDDNDKYDGPQQAADFEFNRTKDPATGKVPMQRLLNALDQTVQSQRLSKNRMNGHQGGPLTPLSWIERGSYTDAAGPFGNTRPNNDVTAGRIRSVCIDSADVTHKTVWVGGVDGGIWKTTDITATPANWALVNDFLSNLAVSGICQNPANNNIMYFCTGESFYNGDAVSGVGVFKSTDHGVTWNFLASSSSFTQCTRILCDPAGNVYLATRGNGLRRSLDGGTTWTNITPAGAPNSDICDLKLSQTGRLHMVTGIFSTQSYFYTDIPSTVTSGSGWNAPATAFPSYTMRAEIAVSGNTLFACPANGAYQVPTIYKSTDGGANWAPTGGQPAGNWANGQGWYSLSVGINGGDPTQCIVGGLDTWKTTDGGATWTKISTWVGASGQYVHADQHNVTWYDGGTKLIFACDGGIHFSTDGGTTIRDRNTNLRIKQFYSVRRREAAAINRV